MQDSLLFFGGVCLFGGGGGGVWWRHTLFLESLVGRNPTYPVVLAPSNPDSQPRRRGP
jgi:hypothetical protein